MSEPSSTITLSHSLATDSRTNLEAWLEDVETQARHQCPQHDETGALSLVVPDRVWAMVPCNIVAGTPPTIRARPTWDMPQAHANNAAAAVVSIYREEATKHRDFSKASSALTTALLDSVGEANRTLLRTTFPTLKPYMLTPRQVVDTMSLKHGVATSDDVSALKEPLSRALTSLSNLSNHMDSFLLASQRLTRSGQGETDFSYFKAFLETVSGFPSIALAMPGYYVTYPVILQQSLATLFPYLETLRDHLVRSDTASPFSGAATQRNRRPMKGKQQQQKQRLPQQQKQQQPQQQHQHRYPKWSPTGPVAFTAATTADLARNPADVAEIQRLNEAMAAMGSSSGYGTQYGMLPPPTPPANAYMSSASRPRQFYCWLHGWNNTHNGAQCNVMGADMAYTQQMKAATSPHGTGGNPKIGVPVSFHRPSSNCFRLSSSFSLSCHPCASHTPFHPPPFSQASGPISAPRLPAAPVFPFVSYLHAAQDHRAPPPPPLLDKDKITILSQRAYANEDIRAPALPAALTTSEAQSVPCVRKGTGTSCSVSWSFPLVTASCAPLSSDPSDGFLSPPRSPAQQDRIRQHITRQDKTRPTQQPQTRPTSISPTTSAPSSRFSHPNPFQTLSVDPFPPEDWLAKSPLLISPFCLSLPNLSPTASPSPPLIADTGCTGILLQFSNFPP